jgi:cell filamentation protein
MADDRREALLVANRLSELSEHPLSGQFDRAHLQSIHSYIFQDVPENEPGKIRVAKGEWWKFRQLENESIGYRVDYATSNISDRLDETLRLFKGPDALRRLSADQFAAQMSHLYGDLDYTHGFKDGNSRTLREFTRTLALQAGHELNWVPTNVDAEKRNHLYMSRDILVLERGLADPSSGRRIEIQNYAADKLVFLRSTGLSLESMIYQNLKPIRERDSAERVAKQHSRGDATPVLPEQTERKSLTARELADRLMKRFSKSRSNEKSGRDYED